MRKRLMRSMLGAVILLASFSVALARMAQQSESSEVQTKAPANLSGLWLLHPLPSAGAYSSFAFTRDEPPMTGWGQEKFRAAKPAFGPNKTAPKESNDPVFGCLPPGLPRIYLHPKPVEMVQLPNEVIMMFEYDRIIRHIYTDGRPHDEFLDPPLWMGDAVGKWEGDTLVIDSIGFNDKTWLDRAGHPHSDALHVVERLRRASRDTLTDEITIEDPKAYTKPWSAEIAFQLQPGRELDWEAVCEDEKLVDRQ